MPPAPPERLRARPYLLSIPPGVPFLECLADGLLDGGLIGGGYPGLRGDPLTLSDARLYLPTRRAARELEAIFARKLGGAAILPKIVPLGTFDEDEEAFAETDESAGGLLPAIGETERRLVLAHIIQRWAKAVAGAIRSTADEADLISTSPSEAVSLAIALGQLIDSFETEGAPWENLAGLVPPEHDDVWKLTTGFLNIAADFWPGYLRDNGKIGGAARRNAQLRELAEAFRADPPDTPVIIAGSTGSNPATAELMEAVARLPYGAVVLHGLDTAADDEVWREIGGEEPGKPASPQAWTHPQHAFYRLLKKLDVQLGEVGHFGRDRIIEARQRLVSTALLPSELTERWAAISMDAGAALDGVGLIEAANEREEALAVALALRETLEVPGRTAALITPDRPLARRVAAELRRWGIETEDSAGLPLADSRAGILARLVAEATAHDLAPHTLLPLLRHPDARFGLDVDTLRRAVDTLEIGVLRGPSPPPGPDGLKTAIVLARNPPDEAERRYWHPAKKRLGTNAWDGADDLVTRLEAALEPLCALGRGGREAAFSDFLSAHRTALAAVRNGADADPDQDTLASFFDEAIEGPSMRIMTRAADYPVLFRTMLRGRVARPQRPGHPRLRILGTLEARLLGFDRVVLGGLNEGSWPAQTQNDPFLSRPMRTALGLPPPEWRVGLSAHDFEQALGGKDVVLTRAKKAGGAPSVAARWLQRLAAVAGKEAWDDVVARGARYLAFAKDLDAASPAPRLREPEPRPPRDLRPTRLSVTEVETLIRDPYAIYARHVLGLQPLDPVGALPEASDRGNIIHGALAEFVQKHDPMAPDAEAKLIEIGRVAFAKFWDFPDVRALWWPRFERIARWFVGWERKRKAVIGRTYTETRGALAWPTKAEREFTLAGRADRFDETAGGYSVIDYKTGTPPGHKEVRAGFAPQLPLEAAMLRAEGFEGVPGGEARDFVYVRLSGQSEAGTVRVVDLGGRSASEVAEERLSKLKELIDIYESEDTPYRSNTNPKFSRRVNGDYDHLARYAEWSVAPEPENGNGNGDEA